MNKQWEIRSEENFKSETVWEGSVENLPYTIADNDGFLIAKGCDNGKETKANARLIAAAPEMYEALKEFWDKAPGGIDYAMLSSIRALLNRIED